MASTGSSSSFRTRFGTALLVGLPGIVALVAYVYRSTPSGAVPAGLSRPSLALLSGLNPLLLLVVACLVGAYAAPRAGLRSHLLDRAGGAGVRERLRPEVGFAVGVGVGGSLLVLALDVALAPFVARDLPQSAIGAARPTVVDVLAHAPVRFLYGGVTEELLLRFGLMSALTLAGWVLVGRRGDAPGPRVIWAAIAISAVLFGVGHLPALAGAVGLTPALVARTVLLNAVAGVAFGWLYWRRSLEAAMVAHAAFHVPLVALSLIQVL
ncbi:CPBP family intramembrane metalloprotease [Halorubrum sp. GN11_10-6_MGM]|uniref:CPBP family intramembrane glutamic endopeptidase n=1 Tax=Halorubrum sp. GN11_10-6_MGM TaxID=2518112 RepID=UPI0010F5AF6F|nr:CPBP family intramembrane glutamic endopeptidase [Halorubrum sp. GN11_10-6_MGM]TKX75163.1 CPBP family intramembrane metalloprotease [Halorubrum sp. GN11_10-6_MGM]